MSKLNFTFSVTVNIMMTHDSFFAIEYEDCNRQQITQLCGWLSNVELVRTFLFGVLDDEQSHISVAVFCAVDDFLKSCNRFWQYPRELVHCFWEIHVLCFVFVFFVHDDRLQLYLQYMACLMRRAPLHILYLILLNIVDEILKCCIRF